MTAKEKNLLENFNLTLEMYQKIYDFQEGKCAICKRPFTEVRSFTEHRHADGLLRGIACFTCNRAIRENFTVEFVSAILDYLKNPPATQALGSPHYGLKGRVGTKKRRKLIKKLKKARDEKHC